MNDCVTEWFLGLPGWARTLVCIATATALATWLISTTLPNPMSTGIEDLRRQLRQHQDADMQNRETFRLMCHGILKMAQEDPGKCDAVLAWKTLTP